MADIMQQAGSDQLFVASRTLRELGGLKGVFKLSDRLAAVLTMPFLSEQCLDLCEIAQPHTTAYVQGSEYVLTLVKLFMASCTPSL